MCARLAAVFCCALACLPVVGAEISGNAASDLVVYVNAGTNQGAPPLAFMREEANSLMQSAGYSIEWRDAKAPGIAVDAPNVVLVKLAGSCTVPMSPIPGVAPPDDNQPSLASTAVQDGTVLPFSRIECTQLTRMLSGMFGREAPARRTYLYGRAMGRLLAHELYHILAQTRDHAAAGVGKPCFTASDLITDRFEFESVALSRLRRRNNDAPVTPSSGVDAAGR
jgi:hypothetical protein